MLVNCYLFPNRVARHGGTVGGSVGLSVKEISQVSLPQITPYSLLDRELEMCYRSFVHQAVFSVLRAVVDPSSDHINGDYGAGDSFRGRRHRGKAAGQRPKRNPQYSFTARTACERVSKSPLALLWMEERTDGRMIGQSAFPTLSTMPSRSARRSVHRASGVTPADEQPGDDATQCSLPARHFAVSQLMPLSNEATTMFTFSRSPSFVAPSVSRQNH